MKNSLPLILVALCGIIIAGLKMFWRGHPEYDLRALIAADVIMCLLSLAAWAMLRKNVSARPQAFVRGVYAATMLRLFACMAGILTYAVINRGHLHKPTLFLMFGIYLLYTIIETIYSSRNAKKVR